MDGEECAVPEARLCACSRSRSGSVWRRDVVHRYVQGVAMARTSPHPSDLTDSRCGYPPAAAPASRGAMRDRVLHTIAAVLASAALASGCGVRPTGVISAGSLPVADGRSMTM